MTQTMNPSAQRIARGLVVVLAALCAFPVAASAQGDLVMSITAGRLRAPAIVDDATELEISSGQAGLPIQLEFTVRNTGPGPAEAGFLTVLEDGVQIASGVNRDEIAPGGIINFTATTTLPSPPAGDPSVVVEYTVSFSGINDTNPNNNSATNFVTVLAGPVDLEPFPPSGATDPIVISTVMGTSTDAVEILDTDTIFVDWAWANLEATDTGAFRVDLAIVDGAGFFFDDDGQPANTFTQIIDSEFGPLPAGMYTIRLTVDTDEEVAEDDETNNVFERTFEVISTGGPAGCNPADLNDASAPNPAAPNFGVPDGILTPTDFSAFAFYFSTGNLAADINDAAAASPAFPNFGVPDGILTPTDFTAFAAYFGAGCPCTLPGCP